MNDGANIRTHDPRVTSANNWILATVGGLMVIAMCWGASSITGLKEAVASLVQQNNYLALQLAKNDQLDDRQADHINAIDRRTVVLEQVSGVQTRGERKDGSRARN